MNDFLRQTLPNTANSKQAPPPVLLGYQQAWIADTAQLKIMEKSRRVGMTWAEAADDVLTAAAEGGSNVFYISATQDMALEFIEACAMWARAFDQAAGQIEEGIFNDDGKDIKTYKIDFPKSGKRVVALSSRPTNLRGKQGVIVIDEAAFHNDLGLMIKAAMAMLLWGDKVRILSTHNGADNKFNELIQEVRAGKRKGSVHKVDFMEAVEQGLYNRVCLRRGIAWTQGGQDAWVSDAYNFYGDDAAEELDVIPSKSGGAFLSMGLIEARMHRATPVVRGSWPDEFAYLPDGLRDLEVKAWCDENLKDILATLDPARAHVFGEDFGRVGDLTVIDIFEEGKDLVGRCKLQVELSRCPFLQQAQILFYIVDRLPRFRSGALDSNGNGAFLAERASQRYDTSRIEEIKLSESFYQAHMPRFKAALQDGTVDCIPLDDQTRDDLRAIRVIDGVPKLPKTKTQKGDGPKLQRHGDSAIAIFLAHYALKREVVPMEFMAVPEKSSRWDASPNNDDDYRISNTGGLW